MYSKNNLFTDNLFTDNQVGSHEELGSNEAGFLLTQDELNSISGGAIPAWAGVIIVGMATAGGGFVGIAGGLVGIGVGCTLGAMAGAAIIAREGIN